MVLLVAPALAPHQPAEIGDVLDGLSWLAGCWQGVDGDRVTEEQWMRPRGGCMVGMSRVVAGGRTVGLEHLRVEVRDATLVYTALPSGQRETRFSLSRFGPGWVEFANPAHDFPQTVRYRLERDGSLLAQVEGPGEAGLRVVEFPFRRVECP